MKKLFVLLFVLVFAGLSKAQWVVDSYDNSVGPIAGVSGPLYNETSIKETNFFANGLTAVMDLSNSSDFYEGTGSMKIDYRIEARDGWGGYCVRTNYHDFTIDSLPYIDLSTGTYLKFRYKVITPADTSKDGTVFMEFKLAEFAELNNGGRDVWYQHNTMDFFDASGTWKEVMMPLELNSDNTLGFANQIADGDGVMQWDKIKGFEVALVYITEGGTVNTPAATGSVLIDKLELVGSRYPKLITFDNSAATWGLDWMDWAGSDKGAIAVTNEGVDTLEGQGSLKVDYTLSAPYDWGGFVAIDTAITVDSTMRNRTALTLFVKNLVPCIADSGRAFIRFFIFENSNGVDEETWITDIGIDLSKASDWNRYYLPLVPKPMGASDRFPPKDGFALNGGPAGSTFNPDFMTKIRIEVFGRGTADGFTGTLKTTGTLLLDIMQQSGFKFDDLTAPDPPVLSVIQSAYSNLVTWVDVPGESDETYSVYYSLNPITDVEADGVDVLALNLPQDNPVFEHVLRSANIDRPRKYYYAVTCKDYAGNVGAAGSFGPVTNNAKGVVTVSITPPATFVADGNLSEWSGITPFVMQSALGSANVPSNYIVNDDNDLSAELKVAVDANYLYVMMDVTDDAYHHPQSLNPWERDEPDLYIGLYNLIKSHSAYGTGATADYQIRFDEDRIRLDGATDCDSLLFTGENYFHDAGTMKFPSGYLFEARIPLTDLVTKRNFGQVSTDVINWKVGDRIPFTVGINDNDNGTNREGMIFYYPQPTEEAYYNVASWGYTWISDEVTGVDDNPNLVNTFDLKQNYPNPFNPSTKIQYSIAEPGLVSIKVFDILGRQIADLVNKQQSAGLYTVDFDAKNLSAGVYFYKIEAGSFQASKKMILLK